jgi:hypothetical protein
MIGDVLDVFLVKPKHWGRKQKNRMVIDVAVTKKTPAECRLGDTTQIPYRKNNWQKFSLLLKTPQRITHNSP